MSKVATDERKRPLWDRILELLEEDLAERRDRKVFVEMQGEAGLSQKEIGELSSQEFRGLDPGLRGRVAEYLVDRYLAEQDRVDLLERRRAYTKRVQELTPADLPAIVEADRHKAEEQRKEHEREEFTREVRKELDRLLVA